MIKTALAKSDLANLCATLYALAQKYIPGNALSDINTLVHIAKILKDNEMRVPVSSKLAAHAGDYAPGVVKQSAEYRLLRARFNAALGTIADMGSKRARKNKSEYHAGIHEGLRRAAKIAIMFIEDIENNTLDERLTAHGKYKDETPKTQPNGGLVR